MAQGIITIVGGSGFLGHYVVRTLAKAGWRMRVVCRRPHLAETLKTAGEWGQIALVAGDLSEPDSVTPHLSGAHAVVNLVGVLAERGTQRFTALHTEGARQLARAATSLGVPTLVQMSALGIDRTAATSAYAKSKLEGEEAVRAAFPDAVILRPSVIFGPGDEFLTRFARMSVFWPFLPIIGGGRSQFQPVYAGDVAAAIQKVIETPACRGNTYELGGPEALSLHEILQLVLRHTGRTRPLVPVPFCLASALAAVLGILPNAVLQAADNLLALPPLTRDQVKLLKHDNVVRGASLTFASLGITPTPLEAVTPGYLRAFAKPVA